MVYNFITKEPTPILIHQGHLVWNCCDLFPPFM